MTPATLRLAFDSGWSHGDPGNGRLRFDSPKLSKVRFLYINARDADEALLGQLVGSWALGDVIVIERMGNDVNRVVAWIIGPVHHCGSYYQVPVAIRSVRGAFAAHDELELHHHKSEDLIQKEQAAEASPVALAPLPAVTTVTFSPRPLAPVAVAVHATPHPQDLVATSASEPQLAPLAPLATDQNAAIASGERQKIEALEERNRALESVLAHLLADPTELYIQEGSRE